MGKGIVKLGEGNWAVKDGNLLAAKETNGRFKNAEFTVSRGTRASYVGRDGLIKESNLQDTNLVPSIITTEDSNGGVINYISSNIYSSTSDGTSASSIRPKFDFNTTSGKTYKLVITPTGTITGTVNFDFYDGSSYLFQNYDFTTTKEIYFTDNGGVFGAFDGQQTYSIDSFTISVQEVKTDTPRIDFTDNADGHLLLEPQSTNLVTYSEDFSAWTANDVTLGDDVTSPDGTTNATTINVNDASALIYENYTVVASTTYTFSFFVKRGTLDSSSFKLSIYDDSNNAFISENISYTTSTEWTRVDHTFTTPSGCTDVRLYTYRNTSGSIGTFFQWGAQLEALSYATSYIPTNGGTVTRDAETCTGAGEAIDFNSEEGVLYVEIAALVNSGLVRYLGLNDGSNNNRVVILNDGTANRIRAIVSSGGTKYADLFYSAADVTDFHKVAVKYKANDFALWIDGVKRAIDTSGSAPIGLNDLEFDLNAGGAFYGKCKAIRVYKEALSDSELTTLTS